MNRGQIMEKLSEQFAAALLNGALEKEFLDKLEDDMRWMPHERETIVGNGYAKSRQLKPTNGQAITIETAAFIDPLPEVPALLKNTPNWIRWRLETGDNGKPTKVPYRVDGRKAASTRAEDWTDYRTAVTGTVIDSQQGVGFVVNGGIVGFDLDGCRNPDTDEIAPWAQSILDALDGSYVEVTPSGLGLRAWARGTLPGTDRVFNFDPTVGLGDKVKIEVYTEKRFFTMTGNPYFTEAGDIKEQDLSKAYNLCHEIRNQYPVKRSPKEAAADGGESTKIELLGSFGTSKYDIFMHGEIESRSPQFVISNRIGRLTYPSQSEADMGFCTVLAIAHAGDIQKIEEDFRNSSLYRPKWDRQDYRDGTISKAIESAQKLAASPIQSTLGQLVPTASTVGPTEQSAIPIIDDPSENDPRFEMVGDTFDTKVYEDAEKRSTPYPDPGTGDLVSALSKKLGHGTPISIAYVREPLKAIVLHAIDGKVFHPAHLKMSLRGNYFSLGESETGKTTGLQFALDAASAILSTSMIHPEDLFRYKSEQTFIRSFTPEGTIKRDQRGAIKSGRSGHSSQFLYIKEGALVANCSEYFGAVFSRLTDLYDQTKASTESMTNGDFEAGTVKVSTVMCFTVPDHTKTFGGKGSIAGGGLNRWGLTNPPEDHSYDDKDWEPLGKEEIGASISPLVSRVFQINQRDPIVLEEEEGAAKIRLEVKGLLKVAGKVGKRLIEYFMREQVVQAITAVDGRLVMTAEQAEYAKKWALAQLQCRIDCWPSDAVQQIETMEHAIRKVVSRHFVSETKLKDVCHLYRAGSGGWFAFNAARKNMVQSGAIKLTGQTRKGTRTYCPGSCSAHLAIKGE
jgi:putative DNA primase/helicase